MNTRYEQRPTGLPRLTMACAALAVSAALSGCDWIQDRFFRVKAPEVRFAQYAQEYQTKPDFAQLEYKLPLTTEELARITPENLAALDQEQIDQIYARLTAGPIPDGAFDGKILLPRGTSGKFRVAEIAGGFAEKASRSRRSARPCGKAKCSTVTSACCETASRTSRY
jgi:hypothetical protein